eukprot:5616224-Prymnesium_polylepis.1
MKSAHGIKHYLDDGYMLLPGGARVPLRNSDYAVEMSFGTAALNPVAMVSSSRPTSRLRGADSTATVPQALLWQRLGFPSEHAWRHVQEVTVDHGLPDGPCQGVPARYMHVRHSLGAENVCEWSILDQNFAQQGSAPHARWDSAPDPTFFQCRLKVLFAFRWMTPCSKLVV